MLAAATVHFPYMTAWPDRASVEHRDRAEAGFAALGRAFAEQGVQTLVVVTSEHIVNLQPRMAPAFVVGVDDSHPAFPEPQFNLAPVTRRGDPALARVLLEDLMRHGFDPAHSSEVALDHGTTLPLQKMGLPPDVAVIPIIINSIFPPLPTLRRCREFGTALARGMQVSPLKRRVGLLATGGISHTVGAPGMERNDPAFDESFVGALRCGDLDAACAWSDSQLDAAGNGTHEIRNWITVAAAMQPRRPRVVTAIDYAPGWDSGVHQLLWEAV